MKSPKNILKISLLNLCLFVFVQNSNAQEAYMGIRFSAVESQLYAENNEINGSSPKYSPAFNVIFSTGRNKLPIGAAFEPGYTIKGAKINDSSTYKLNYLNLPLMLDVYPMEWLKISAGPEISYLMKGTNKVSSRKEKITSTFDNRMELSGSLSISASVAFFLDLGFRYNKGFTSIAENHSLLAAQSIKNNSMQLFLDFKIANY